MAGLKVLAPLDGSEATYRALKRGLSRLATPATVTLLVVRDAKLLEMPDDAREHLELDDEDEVILRDDEARHIVEKGRTVLKDLRGVKAVERIVVGSVEEAVVEASNGHDVLLMHALRRVERADERQGSMTELLARAARCDVLLVYDDEFS